MSKIVNFFTKKKNSGNKENDASLKRVNFERASTRSEVGADAQRERDRVAMRAIPNPYSVWTEPKKTKGPASCPGGVARDSTYHNERRSVRPPKQERAGSVYGGDMSTFRQYRIDGPSPDEDVNSSHYSRKQQQQQHGHRGGGGGSSRRYGDLSAIEERSERSDRSMQQYSHHEWNRSSQHRPAPSQSYMDYTSGDSEDEDDGYVRRLEHKIEKLKDDKSRYRNQLEHKKNDLEYANYKLRDTEEQLRIALDRNSKMEREVTLVYRKMEKMQHQLKEERKQAELLSLRLSEMTTSATSNGAMERLVSSSETSLDMEADETEEGVGGDEVRNFRASDSVVTAAGSTTAADETAAVAAGSEAEEMELPRGEETPSPFELRRSFSDMGPVSMVDGAGEEMAEGGSWRRRDKRRSFVKRPLLAPPQESESSDGEKVLMMERQVRKKGAVVKYDPNRREKIKEKHYRRFGKHERSALDGFTFLDQEVTDISGMLSSPNEGNY